MSNNLRLLIVLIVMVLVGMGSSRIFTAQPAQAQRLTTRWEYVYIVAGDAKDLVAKANDIASQGWEVIAVMPYDESRGIVAYLKRTKS